MDDVDLIDMFTCGTFLREILWYEQYMLMFFLTDSQRIREMVYNHSIFPKYFWGWYFFFKCCWLSQGLQFYFDFFVVYDESWVIFIIYRNDISMDYILFYCCLVLCNWCAYGYRKIHSIFVVIKIRFIMYTAMISCP